MKYFYQNRLGCVSLLLSALLSSASYAANDTHDLVIANHFSDALTFTIGINPQTLPDLPATFTLNSNQEAKSVILSGKEAYIRVEDSNNHSAFWGVEVSQDKTVIHGYLSHGIAYSWANNIITFCTPEVYKQKHSC